MALNSTQRSLKPWSFMKNPETVYHDHMGRLAEESHGILFEYLLAFMFGFPIFNTLFLWKQLLNYEASIYLK